MKIVNVVGARPNFVKIAPLVKVGCEVREGLEVMEGLLSCPSPTESVG